MNSTLLERRPRRARVGELKQEHGTDLTDLGSGELIHALMARQAVDEFVLMIHPLVLGTGRRLFDRRRRAGRRCN